MGTDDGQRNDEFLFKELTREIIGAAFEVHNQLGCGLLEKVYENGLAHELRLKGRVPATQVQFPVLYKGENVGTYYADLVVEDKVILEVKAVAKLDDTHRAQLMNYLKISGLRVGLLFNFAKPRLVHERFVV